MFQPKSENFLLPVSVSRMRVIPLVGQSREVDNRAGWTIA